MPRQAPGPPGSGRYYLVKASTQGYGKQQRRYCMLRGAATVLGIHSQWPRRQDLRGGMSGGGHPLRELTHQGTGSYKTYKTMATQSTTFSYNMLVTCSGEITVPLVLEQVITQCPNRQKKIIYYIIHVCAGLCWNVETMHCKGELCQNSSFFLFWI
jgi:hypothetical protein